MTTPARTETEIRLLAGCPYLRAGAAEPWLSGAGNARCGLRLGGYRLLSRDEIASFCRGQFRNCPMYRARQEMTDAPDR